MSPSRKKRKGKQRHPPPRYRKQGKAEASRAKGGAERGPATPPAPVAAPPAPREPARPRTGRVVSLDPLAPIIVRSGRPMNHADADPAQFPPPSTIAGCLRTAWGPRHGSALRPRARAARGRRTAAGRRRRPGPGAEACRRAVLRPRRRQGGAAALSASGAPAVSRRLRRRSARGTVTRAVDRRCDGQARRWSRVVVVGRPAGFPQRHRRASRSTAKERLVAPRG